MCDPDEPRASAGRLIEVRSVQAGFVVPAAYWWLESRLDRRERAAAVEEVPAPA